MKLYFLFLQIFLSGLANAQVKKKFDIFSYTVPAGFTLKASNEYLYYEKYEGKNYCQLFLYPATTGQNDTEKDFAKTWDFFARNPAQQVNDPETKESNTKNEWQNIFGAARGSYNNQMFAVTLSSFTKKDMTYSIAAVFTDKKFLPIAQKFIESVVPDEKKYVRKEITTPNTKTDIVKSQGAMTITKFTTNFDDGWTASPTTDYVKVSKSGTEVRLHYTDPALDDARPKTVDAPEYYWSKYVSPYFTVSNPQKWSGVQYPVIYFMEGNAIDRQTGKSCYVAIKIVYSGGARPIVVVALNQNSYQQQFPHPNGIDNMLNYNKFAVTVKDIAGTWTGGGGGGVEYYNAYSGTYAGMSACIFCR